MKHILEGGLVHLAIVAVLYGVKEVWDQRSYDAAMVVSDMRESGDRRRGEETRFKSEDLQDVAVNPVTDGGPLVLTTTEQVGQAREQYGGLY